MGYRFLADEWLPDGLQVKESVVGGSPMAPKGAPGAGTHDCTLQSQMQCLHGTGHAGQTRILSAVETGKAGRLP